jgi:two-component system, chemotaxis family, protein-glutamate methylesterase/glutaminase
MAEKHVINPSRLVVMGGSSGSLDALLVILPLLKKDFTIPVIIVLHRSSNTDNGLSALLAGRTHLQVKEADEKERLQQGWIYLAPPDYHLLLEENGTLSLDASEKIYYSRPSIHVTFTSAAAAYGSGLIAILLSGANADGAEAMKAVKEYGGTNIVQNPGEAIVGFMPEQAIQLAPIDHILPASAIALLLNEL